MVAPKHWGKGNVLFVFTRKNCSSDLFYFLRKGVAMYFNLASNSRSSCLSLQSAGITVMHYHPRQNVSFE
jgi:hypothetical protein